MVKSTSIVRKLYFSWAMLVLIAPLHLFGAALNVPASLTPDFFGYKRLKPFEFGRTLKDFAHCLRAQDRMAYLLEWSVKNDERLFFLRENERSAMYNFINNCLKKDLADDAREWLLHLHEKLDYNNQRAVFNGGNVAMMRCIFTISPYTTATVLMHGNILQRYIDDDLTGDDERVVAEFLKSDNDELRSIGQCLLSALQSKKHRLRLERFSKTYDHIFNHSLISCFMPYTQAKLSTSNFLSLLNDYTGMSIALAERRKTTPSLTIAQWHEIERQGSTHASCLYNQYFAMRSSCDALYQVVLTCLKNIVKQLPDTVCGKSSMTLLNDGDNGSFSDSLDGQEWFVRNIATVDVDSPSTQEQQPAIVENKKVGTKNTTKPKKKKLKKQVTAVAIAPSGVEVLPQAPSSLPIMEDKVEHDRQMDDTMAVAYKELSWIKPFANKTTVVETLPTLTKLLDYDNDMEIFLYNNNARAQRANIAMPFSYTHNVHEWFNDAARALIDQHYCGPFARADLTRFASTQQSQWHAVSIHRFSLLVDDYINQYGITKRIPDRLNPGELVSCVVIPGAVRYAVSAGNKHIEACCFTYLFNARGQCFHRLIERRDQRTFITDVLGGAIFNEIEFPALTQDYKEA